ncbi:hypothetical protein [Rubrobacter indicoceani]|uniref:hypothetical protein n=1 Tax=Rubrobacter indicoceani TaxID=2051957 RepID=UPI000E5BF2AF|nr:hypothetical protein [Rubrobacter indicoceani]
MAQKREVRHYMRVPGPMPYEQIKNWRGKDTGQWHELERIENYEFLETVFPAAEGWKIINHTIVQLGGAEPGPPVLSILGERFVEEKDETL